ASWQSERGRPLIRQGTAWESLPNFPRGIVTEVAKPSGVRGVMLPAVASQDARLDRVRTEARKTKVADDRSPFRPAASRRGWV
ncbi:MAG: hypothetical protein ACK56I_20700, partial [bacterium]